MKTAKVEFRMGGIDFCGEGEPDWVAAQLDKVLEKAPDIIDSQCMIYEAETSTHASLDTSSTEAEGEDSGRPVTGIQNRIMNVSLEQYLKDKHAVKSQVARFLATAQWLHMRGNRKPTTRDITKALIDNGQERMKNPADCLNKNVKKGFCKKDGRQFYVTAAGRKSLV